MMPARSSAVSTLTSKGQVTIPEKIRSELQLQAGDRLEWRTTSTGAIEVVKVGRDWRDLVGMLGAPTRSVSVEQMDVELADWIRRRHARR